MYVMYIRGYTKLMAVFGVARWNVTIVATPYHVAGYRLKIDHGRFLQFIVRNFPAISHSRIGWYSVVN
jgi:hypothetical protein